MTQTIETYLDSLQNKTVAVIGMGVSNTPLIRLLMAAGIALTVCDKSTMDCFPAPLLEELTAGGVVLRLGEDYLEDLNQDVIFRTPGLHPYVPQLIAAVARGSVLTSEMEVFFQVCPCPIIAVTGSDGKTTTTTIIAGLLNAAGYHTYVGGNIGTPLLARVGEMKASDRVVLELSSFQLMTMTQSPAVAVVTNLAPNHLDVHGSMEEYVAAKTNIFAHQTATDVTVLNGDNAITAAFASRVPGHVRLFGRKMELTQGVYLKEGTIFQNNTPVLAVDEITLPGVHNIENYMAAIAAVDGLVPHALIGQFAKEFGGVEHRIELVSTIKGVRYYNDSIASSPSRTIAGLHSFSEKVCLLAGGYDKQIPFDDLGTEIATHVKRLYLTGDTKNSIRHAVEQSSAYQPESLAIKSFDTLEESILAAHRDAQPGDVVLLSPACASFDQFKNFAQRGNFFKEIVHTLEETE